MTENTYSLCPVCLKQVPTQYIAEGDTIYMMEYLV